MARPPELLQSDSCALSLELSLDLISLCLADSFLEDLRSGLDCFLRFLQAKAGDLTDDLDDLDLVRADVSQLDSAYDRALNDPEAIRKRQWIIDNYDPYFDGKVCQRMLEGAQDYINRHGVPERRHLNLWRKYTSIKTFGRIRRH